MPNARPPVPRTTLSLKLGGWLEAHATGWGVAAIPLVVVLAIGGAMLTKLIV